uniref:protein unc-93 homolog A-like isoform X3 n=1 Tax=Oncorhynchus gorbuscha TaxID=8017 RepID=UPI001EAF79FC|nr:protein unc-93 homolog A-like isoform X3 [Oncorhynchus gorbuscha]
MKNVLVVSFGFLLLFTATGSLLNLQSSLNTEEGVGVASASVQFASIILSSMFVAPLVIKYLGCKWTIVAAMGCNVVYTVGNFYPGWETLLPTSIILGFGESPLWSATSTYLTINGRKQAEKDNKKTQDVINQYFGILFLLYQSSAVWGNLMSSIVFGQDSTSVNISESDLQFCGVGSCGNISEAPSNSTRPPERLVHTLMGCYVGVGVLAMLLVAVFLDNIDRDMTLEFRSNKEPFCSTFLATFKQLNDRRQVFLIPVTAYIGLELGFLNGEYTKPQPPSLPVSWVCCSGGLTQTSCQCSLCFLPSGAWQTLCGRHKPMHSMVFSSMVRRRQHLPTIAYGRQWDM